MIKFIQELKNKFYTKCDIDKQYIYNKYSYDSCVERWAKELNDEYYIEFFKNVATTQMDLDDEVFVLFRYEQGCDYDFDPLIRQCRSIVIDVMNEKIVLYPFDKFFNINEREETSFENIEKYYIVGGLYWNQCIPYEGNEHLLSTTDECDKIYKTW